MVVILHLIERSVRNITFALGLVDVTVISEGGNLLPALTVFCYPSLALGVDPFYAT